jgi:hypothetical protein
MKNLLFMVVAVWAATTAAQEPAPPKPRAADDVWVLQMHSPSREYAVRMSALQMVTLQDFDVRKEGKIQRVVELSVETTGGNRARFFWEDKPQELVKLPTELDQKRREVEQAMKDLTGIERAESKGARVQKDYPVTTHSGWAEFKLDSEQEVLNLHKQLMEMWTGRKRNE